MRGELPASPFGAARRAFLGSDPQPDPEEAAWLRLAAGCQRSFDLPPELPALAWELSGWGPPGHDPGARQGLALLALGALLAQRDGSTRVPLPGPAGRGWWGRLLERLLADDAGGPPPEAELARRLDALEALLAAGADGVLGPTGSRTPLVHEGGHLYLEKVERAEAELAGLLAALVRSAPHPPLAAAEPEGALALSDEQRGAIAGPVERPLSLISGGPGTGKTWVVRALLRLLLRAGLTPGEVALAAPTAKAAQRLAGSLAPGSGDAAREAALREVPAPVTLHRLLGYQPRSGQFRHDRSQPHPARVVIVDEASMIDVELCLALLRALRPGARLVLIGDADQLPSVGAGLVLRDLVGGPDRPGPLASGAVFLTRSYRVDAGQAAGQQVLRAARAAREGAWAALEEGITWRAGPEALAWEGVEGWEGPTRALLPAFLERWYAAQVVGRPDFAALVERVYRVEQGRFPPQERARVEEVLAHLERARLLCPTRVLPWGAEAVNARLHALALARARAGEGQAWTAGEPLLVLENDYQQQVWNGEQGVTLRVAEEGRPPRLMAVFRRSPGPGVPDGVPEGGGLAAFHLELLGRRITHGYALTVHKAQGSEHRHVGLVLPEQDSPLLTRELLYTALTRARASLTLIGPRGALRQALARPVERWSGLPERLARRLG